MNDKFLTIFFRFVYISISMFLLLGIYASLTFNFSQSVEEDFVKKIVTSETYDALLKPYFVAQVGEKDDWFEYKMNSDNFSALIISLEKKALNDNNLFLYEKNKLLAGRINKITNIDGASFFNNCQVYYFLDCFISNEVDDEAISLALIYFSSFNKLFINYRDTTTALQRKLRNEEK
ncbi:MAG: hypothetical protein ACRC37_07530 [Lentisphaeria bacterium]